MSNEIQYQVYKVAQKIWHNLYTL